MNSLIRCYAIADALTGTAHADEAKRLAEIARTRAHSHPRGNIGNISRRLRKMAQSAGVWTAGLGVEG